MVVYVEYVLADNLIIDFLLLTLARKTYKLPTDFLRTAVSSVLGALAALAFPLLSRFGGGWIFLLRLVTGVLLVLIAGKFKNLKEFIFCYYLFIFYTLLFGGAVAAAFYLSGIKYDALTGVNAADFPLGFSAAVCSIIFLAVNKAVKALYKRKDVVRFTVDCAVSLCGECYPLKGFIDSGNRLVYKKTGSPVVLCSPSAAKKIFFANDFSARALGNMEITTVTGKSFIKLYKLDKIVIYRGDAPNIINNVVMGLSEVGFDGDGDFDLILSPILA